MVDVNGDVTPTTNQKIKKIDASEWDSASLSDLYDHMNVLNNRLLQANECGAVSIAQQLQRGINRLQQIINSRNSSDINLL